MSLRVINVRLTVEAQPGDTRDSVHPLEGSFTLSQGVVLPASAKSDAWLRLNSAMISNTCPNVYSYATFNNRLVRVRSGAGPWTQIMLPTGRYEPEDIGAAISEVVGSQLGWLVDNDDPALLIVNNRATNEIQIQIDSTKMVGGAQFSLDLNSSSIGKTLGFSSAIGVLTADGKVKNDTLPNLFTQSSSVCVTSAQAPARLYNTGSARILGVAPLYRAERTVRYLFYPRDGENNPELHYEGERTIKTINLKITQVDGVTPALYPVGSEVLAVIEFGLY